MNSKFLIYSSFLIALLCHLAFFSIFTFVFSIDPASPKPKFFFLGPILSQSDIKHTSTKKSNPKSNNDIRSITSMAGLDQKTAHQEKNPFSIQSIKKPLMPRASEPHIKKALKTTFDIEPASEIIGNEEEHLSVETKLKIKPYRPLRFKPSKKDSLK